MLGGMWGFRNEMDRSLANKIYALMMSPQISSNYKHNNEKGHDQFFLGQHVYPYINENAVVHDSFLCKSFGGGAFPTQRVGMCHIGGQNNFDCQNDLKNEKFAECPVECRPKEHSDWMHC